MTLQDNFYTVLKESMAGGCLDVRIRLLPGNIIFQSHFPEYSITPGAVQIRIATELLKRRVFPQLVIKEACNIKFMTPLLPDQELTYSFENLSKDSEGNVRTSLNISSDAGTCSRMDLVYSMNIPECLSALRCCVIIPCYDNAGTVADVVRRTLTLCRDVIVVDDGSHDGSADEVTRLKTEGAHLHLIRHEHNKGKGQALKTGFKAALSLGFERAVSLDSDGQHYPEDIADMVAAAMENPEAMLVGCRNLHHENMPGGNTFANRFSNFWFSLQTGVHISDTQCGFRLYQLRRLGLQGHGLWFLTSRYEAELELLVSQCWKGVPLIEVPVNVYYPPRQERISHFRPFRDFMRITVLNIILCLLALFYGYPRKLISRIPSNSPNI